MAFEQFVFSYKNPSYDEIFTLIYELCERLIFILCLFELI